MQFYIIIICTTLIYANTPDVSGIEEILFDKKENVEHTIFKKIIVTQKLILRFGKIYYPTYGLFL